MSYGTDAPQGLQPIGTLTGAPWTASLRTYNLANAYGTSLFNGDPLAPAATGTVARAVAGANTAANVTLGVFQACYYVDSTNVIQKRTYWPASTATATNTLATVDAIVDPSVIYTIQVNGDSGSGAAALTNQFGTFDYSFATAGNTLTGYSGVTLDLDTATPTSQYSNMKIIDLTPFEGNTWGLQYNNVSVIINNNFLRAGVAGV